LKETRETEAVFKKSEEELNLGRAGSNSQRKQAHARAPDVQNPDGKLSDANDLDRKETDTGKQEVGQVADAYRNSQAKDFYESAATVRERKARFRHHYHDQRQVKAGRLQFDKMESDGSLDKRQAR